MCKFSIIMATFNSEAFIHNALCSFINQTYDGDYEIIVVDGGSKDKTVEILGRYDENIIKWISEPDNGIYDAWNKGVKISKGDWILFVGSDDCLIATALKDYADFLLTLDQDIEYISSKNLIVDKNGLSIRVKGWKWEWPYFLKEMTVAHPGSLHSNKLYKKYGYYNTDFKIVGDYEFLLRAKNELKSAFMDKITVNMMEGGTSDTLAGIWEAFRASTETGKKPYLNAYFNSLYISLKFVVKSLFRKAGINFYLKK